jgi:hypothetical protein
MSLHEIKKPTKAYISGTYVRDYGGRMSRRILEWKPMGRRIRGRPRKR